MSAGILAICGGLTGLVIAQTGYSGLRVVERLRDPEVDLDWDRMQLENQMELCTGAVFAVLLGLGGVLLLARRPAGVTMVTIGSGLGTFVCLGPLATYSVLASKLMFVGMSAVSALILVLVVLPSTQRWIDARPKPQLTPPNGPHPAVAPYN
ncbi:hypothetical protein [Nocardia caishijiensis]|uniref:Uncharacterized protein n=1 Tax=Nocardia caishijiensis TaxID=184756 RepID=A0ABQ6YV22_9NOCA|nr:hypothetical protein [Nocardia caishijiensis]KAF0849660.1 hypothetical protein FNL39_1011104 [Nocardia caishijiensis]